MITVLMQTQGGHNKVSDVLSSMILDDANPLSDRPYTLSSCLFPEAEKHPEDQVKLVKRWVKEQKDFPGINLVVATHSLIIIYALNNELLRNAWLQVEAYAINKNGAKTSAANNRWIDERVLGKVVDKLGMEMIKLSL